MTTQAIIRPSHVLADLLGPTALLGMPSFGFPAGDAFALPGLEPGRLLPVGAKRPAKDEDEKEGGDDAADEEDVDEDDADEEDDDLDDDEEDDEDDDEDDEEEDDEDEEFEDEEEDDFEEEDEDFEEDDEK